MLDVVFEKERFISAVWFASGFLPCYHVEGFRRTTTSTKQGVIKKQIAILN